MGAAVSRRRLRSRRPRRPLRHQQQGRLAATGCTATAATARSRTSPSALGVADAQPARAPASRWARSGATTTTTASRTCSSTGGAGPSCSTTTAAQRFTRVTDTAGLPAWANINAAVWLDYDRDGRLDLFLGGYYPEDVEPLEARRHEDDAGELRVRQQRRPQVPVSATSAAARFEEVSAQVGHRRRGAGRWRRSAADLRGTGYPDLFIANDYGVSELFVNEGGRFREVGRETGVGYAPKSGMNASVGDVLNQGRFAIYVSNISEEGILLQGNNLWVPTGGTPTAAHATRTWRARWASTSAAGASARSSAT